MAADAVIGFLARKDRLEGLLDEILLRLGELLGNLLAQAVPRCTS
jgi:hypothetical protein